MIINNIIFGGGIMFMLIVGKKVVMDCLLI